jgi:hypothetical protein
MQGPELWFFFSYPHIFFPWLNYRSTSLLICFPKKLVFSATSNEKPLNPLIFVTLLRFF